MSQEPDNARRGRPPLLLILGFGLFVLILVVIVASSLTRRNVATFALRDPRLGGLTATPAADTITIDTTDPERWRFLDIDQGRVLAPPDTAGWDLALRRYHFRTSGAIADLDQNRPTAMSFPLDTVPEPRAFDIETEPAVARWYEYNMWSHLLEPLDRAYVLVTTEGRMAKLRVLSYYCPGLQAGCLTLRYEPWDVS